MTIDEALDRFLLQLEADGRSVPPVETFPTSNTRFGSTPRTSSVPAQRRLES